MVRLPQHPLEKFTIPQALKRIERTGIESR